MRVFVCIRSIMGNRCQFYIGSATALPDYRVNLEYSSRQGEVSLFTQVKGSFFLSIDLKHNQGFKSYF